MPDPINNDDEKKGVPLLVRIFLAWVASSASAFILTWCSMHGIDFQVWKIDSEVVKANITGILTGVATAPECIPLGIAALILFLRKAWRTIRNAATRNLPPDDDSEKE